VLPVVLSSQFTQPAEYQSGFMENIRALTTDTEAITDGVIPTIEITIFIDTIIGIRRRSERWANGAAARIWVCA